MVVTMDFRQLSSVSDVRKPYLRTELVHMGEPIDDGDARGRDGFLGAFAVATSVVVDGGLARDKD